MPSWFNQKTIRSRLFRFQLIGLCISVLAAVSVWQLYIEPAFRSNLAKTQSETAERAADAIANFVEARIRELQMTAQIGGFWRDGNEWEKEPLHQLLKLATEIEEVSMIDGSGQERIRISRRRFLTDDDLRFVGRLPVIRSALQGRLGIGPVYYAANAEPRLALAVPLKARGTGVRAVLKADINLNTLWKSVSGLRVGSAGHLYVVDGKGDLIAHPNYSKVLLGVNLSHVPEVAEFLSERTTDREPAKPAIGEDGENVLTTFAGVPKMGWGVIVEEPAAAAYADLHKLKMLAGIILSLAMIAVIAVSHRFSERLSAPVRELEHGAERIAGGDLAHRLDIRTGDELESLAEKFNGMAQALKQSHDDLEERINERTREISALYAAVTPLQPSDSMSRLLENVIERLLIATGADAALIRLRDADSGALRCPVARGFDAGYLEKTATLTPQSAAFFVLTHGLPVIASDIATDARLLGKQQLAGGLRSCALLPLIVAEKVRGIIHVASRRAGFFKPESENRLTAIAHQMSIVIENHHLFTETRSRQEKLQALYAIAETVSRSLDVRVLAQAALATTIEVLKLAAGGLYLFDPREERLDLVAHRGIASPRLDRIQSFVPGSGLIGATFEKAEPVVFPNDNEDPVCVALAGVVQSEGGPSRRTVGVPIGLKERTVGVMFLHGAPVAEFEAQDLELLSAVGRQIATAMENARLFEETNERARQQAALNTITAAISQLLDREELFKIALEKVIEVTGRERASIRLKNADTGQIELCAYRGLTEAEVKQLRSSGPHRTSQEVFDSGKAVVINQSDADRHGQSLLARSRSVAWVPMRARGIVVGVLGISATRPIAFTAREVEFLQAVANVIGVALDNACAYEETRRNLERIRALHEIDRAILGSLDLKKVLNVLLEKIEVFLPFAGATSIRLLNRENGMLEPISCRGLNEEQWRASGTISCVDNPVVQNKAPLAILNVQKEPGPLNVEFLEASGLVSLLLVPLLAKGEVLGVLSFYTREEHCFSAKEIEFLTTLAGQAAIAIYNSQLYGELRDQAFQLERSNNIKSEFLGIMSHELTTPITAIMGYATLIEQEVMGAGNAEQKHAARVIHRKGEELLAMVRGILEAAKLDAGGAVVEPASVDVTAVIDDLKGSFRTTPEKPLALYWHCDTDLPPIRTDRGKLRQILHHLIENALKFTAEGAVKVSVHYDHQARAVRFQVKDTGVGIAPEMLPNIFDKFRQADSSDTRCYEGMGLGLFIAKKFTDLLGGEISAESRPGKGSTFRVILPCAYVGATTTAEY